MTISVPTNVNYRNVQHAKGTTDAIYAYADKLRHFYDRIVTCNVMIDRPHLHHQNGNDYRVHIQIAVPGSNLNVQAERFDENVLNVVHAAFMIAEKRLKTFKSKQERFEPVKAQ